MLLLVAVVAPAINGRRDQPEGKLWERYAYAKDQVRKDVDLAQDDLIGNPADIGANASVISAPSMAKIGRLPNVG